MNDTWNESFDEDRLRISFSEADLQLVVGAGDLKSIERDIGLFQQNSEKFQMIVTSPGPRLTGALKFGAGTFISYAVDNSNMIQNLNPILSDVRKSTRIRYLFFFFEMELIARKIYTFVINVLRQVITTISMVLV